MVEYFNVTLIKYSKLWKDLYNTDRSKISPIYYVLCIDYICEVLGKGGFYNKISNLH